MTTYHHGNLRAALIDSALVVLAEKGVSGFSLREAARRAGVSQSAPKHHFIDTRGLLTELAVIAFKRLADRLKGADNGGTSHMPQIQAQAAAYVEFALAEPALFDLMWRASLLDLTNPDLLEQKQRAFAILDRRVRGANAMRGQQTDAHMAPTYACWSIVHGFARLALDGAIGDATRGQKELQELLPAMLELLDV